MDGEPLEVKVGRGIAWDSTDLETELEEADPDEEIEFLSNPVLEDRVSRVFAAFDSITVAARQGALLREGLNVVIAGSPNAAVFPVPVCAQQRIVSSRIQQE